MKISTRAQHGLKAILHLALRYGQGSVAVSYIAKKQSIPVAALGQILNTLKKRGLVQSVRGPQGGYVLSKKPSEINLKELLDALEGQGHPLKKLKKEKQPLSDPIQKTSDFFWQSVDTLLSSSLQSKNLKDILNEYHVKHPAPTQKNSDFNI